METPIIRLTRDDFLTGLSGSAFSGQGGIFYKAKGVSAIRDIGSAEESNTGLLIASPAGVYGGSGVVVDTPVAGAKDYSSTVLYLYVLGSSGHLYRKTNDSTNPTDLRSSTQISNVANGIAIFQPRGGTKYLYYWQKQQIGRWDLSGSYPTGWVDNQYTGLENTTMHPTHKFLDYVFYGNDYKIGRLADDGAGGVTHSTNVLDFPQNLQVTALEDDGVYLVAALSADKDNVGALAEAKIIFWDTFSSSWQREYSIGDTIVDMHSIGNVVYGIGRKGIYIISFGGGVQKIWDDGTNVMSGSNRVIGPGCLSSYNDALIWADSDGSVGLLGKPSPKLRASVHKPIVPNSGSSVSFVDGEFAFLNVVVGDSNPALAFYGMLVGSDSSVTDTDVTAQTRYIDLKNKYDIHRVDVVFGEPLASGDSLTVSVYSDEDTAATAFGTVTTAGRKRFSLFPTTPIIGAENISIGLTYGGGAPKVSAIEVYGEARTNDNNDG